MEPRHPLSQCGTCPLYCPPQDKLDPWVRGGGPPQADLVIVGDAPGATEIILRRAFSGKSGQLLNRLLREVGLDRDGVYVCNAVSCASRSQNANVPTPTAAMRACQARLFVEVTQRRPKVVVALGGAALRAFSVDEKITGCRGREQWIEPEALYQALLKGRPKTGATLPVALAGAQGFYLMPSFHPAFALRNPDVYPDLARDFKRVVSLLDQAPAIERELPPVETVVPSSVYQALKWLDVVGQQPVVACDIESSSKDVFTDRLLTLAYAWRDDDTIRALVLPADLCAGRLVRAALSRLHGRRATRFVWWNGKFDRAWYKHHLGVDVRIDGDGLLAHYSLDPRRGIHGLKGRASDDLGASDYEAEIKGYVRNIKGVAEAYAIEVAAAAAQGLPLPEWQKPAAIDYSRIPIEKLVEYTAQDVGMTLMLVERYERELSGDPHADWVYRSLLLPAAAVLSDVELAGAAVDVGALRALDGEFGALLDNYVAAMQEAVGQPVNPASHAQVMQVLYGTAVREQYEIVGKPADDLPSFELAPILEDDRPTASGDACDKLLQIDGLDPQAWSFVMALRHFRQDAMLHRTYIKALPLQIKSDGRVRASFQLHTTSTGRLSSRIEER